MKYSLSATSIIESMIVLLIVVTWIVWVYTLLTSSQKLSDSTSRRIEAIQIARDGLESFTNIRDTNWIKFSADYRNCWNTLNYNSSCIGNNWVGTDITHWITQWLLISQNANNQFIITRRSHPAAGNFYSNSTYRSQFAIRKDSNGFYTQVWWTIYWVNGNPFYTREIQIDYLDNNGNSLWPSASNNSRMKVTSIVQWQDIAKSTPQKLEISTVLTNWKSQK